MRLGEMDLGRGGKVEQLSLLLPGMSPTSPESLILVMADECGRSGNVTKGIMRTLEHLPITHVGAGGVTFFDGNIRYRLELLLFFMGGFRPLL